MLLCHVAHDSSWAVNVIRDLLLNNFDMEKTHQLFSLGLPVPLPLSVLVFSQVYGRVPWRFFPRVSVCVSIRGPLQHETAEASLLKEMWPSVRFSLQLVCSQNCFLWSSTPLRQPFLLWPHVSAVVLRNHLPVTNPHPHSCFLDCVACQSPNTASISQTAPS